MSQSRFSPRALFLSNDGSLYSDTLICSGLLPAKLGGKPCPFAQAKQMPDPQVLNREDPDYASGKGKPGDLCPPCAVMHVGALGEWEGHERYFLPEELLPLRLFLCKQEFWFVVMGLNDDEATHIVKADEPPGDDEGEDSKWQ